MGNLLTKLLENYKRKQLDKRSFLLKSASFAKFGWKPLQDKVFLKKYRWRPDYIFECKKFTILVDVLLTNTYPHLLYKYEIPKILKNEKNARVCFLIPDLEETQFIENYCKSHKIGLKKFNSYEDIETLLPLNFEKKPLRKAKKTKDEGWFPHIILNNIKNLKNLVIKQILYNFSQEIIQTQDKDKQLKIIYKYVELLLKSNNNFKGSNKNFIKLSLFEKFSSLQEKQIVDHAFHSFRVFLIGCIIIDHYYGKFMLAYKYVCPKVAAFSIEYVWILTAIFHDIGYVEQDVLRGIGIDPQNIDPILIEEYRGSLSKIISVRWAKPEYSEALENIICLISKLQYQNKITIPFIGVAEYNMKRKLKPNKGIERFLLKTYNDFASHSVISCFNLVADIMKDIKAIGIKAGQIKAFLYNHLYLAAISICYHDWKLWDELRAQTIFPLKFERYAFAILLIYIDTWDDYKRDKTRNISIDEFIFEKNQFAVRLTWDDQKQYDKEKIKYDNFNQSMLFDKNFSLCVRVSNAE